ncbi:MAG: protoporphyrinogen oxidase [Armatimonadota bacterium]
MKRIVVIGGGVTGLAAAHRLVELRRERGLDLQVQLLEAGPRLGGVIGTELRGEFVLEQGPDSIITDKPWGVALARRIGLEGELVGTNDEHRRSFVVRGGQLVPVPEGFQLLAPSRFAPLAASPIFSWGGKARMALDLVIPPRRDDADESLGGFVLRRLGREALDRMAQPMIAGIYGADPMELSLRATLPRFLDMEREHGSVIRGMWARMRQAQARTSAGNGEKSGVSGARYGLFASFRRGMQTLTDALAARLPEGAARLEKPVRALERDGSGWRVVLEGEEIAADGVVVALPAYRAADLVAPHEAELAVVLRSVPYASAATLSLCYRREDVPHPLDGFGFVVPKLEGLTLHGCTFTNVKYPHRAPAGVALLRAFLGEGALQGRGREEVEARVRADLRKLLGITAEPQFTVFWRGEQVMPQYRVGHLERVGEIERRVEALPGLRLAGNAYRGVGIPDCIHSAETAVEGLLAAG